MFFVFDGIDGAGKSTQLSMFVGWLESLGHSVITCRDPGSTQLGNRLRSLLLDKHQIPIHIRTEMLLFTAARTQLVEEVIRPALDDGKFVVLDRYIFSTVVYQGYAGNLDPADIWSINRTATAGLMPRVTFILDLDVDLAARRLNFRSDETQQGNAQNPLDRMESRGRVYFEKVRQGFLQEANRWPDQVEVIDANRPSELIHSEITKLATNYIRRSLPGTT